MFITYVNGYCVEQSLVAAQPLVLVLFPSMCAWTFRLVVHSVR